MITLDKLKQQLVDKKSEIESLKRYEKEIESKIQEIKNNLKSYDKCLIKTYLCYDRLFSFQ